MSNSCAGTVRWQEKPVHSWRKTDRPKQIPTRHTWGQGKGRRHEGEQTERMEVCLMET